MRTEDATRLDDRFLMISDVLAPDLIDELDGKFIPESIVKFRQKGRWDESIDAAAKAYLERTRSDNCITCYTIYAYGNVSIGKKFDVVFDAAKSGRHCISPLYLRHAVWACGYYLPVQEMVRGHKHFCVFECPQGIPELLARMPKTTNWEKSIRKFRLGLTDAEAWTVLQQTYGSHQ